MEGGRELEDFVRVGGTHSPAVLGAAVSAATLNPAAGKATSVAAQAWASAEPDGFAKVTTGLAVETAMQIGVVLAIPVFAGMLVWKGIKAVFDL